VVSVKASEVLRRAIRKSGLALNELGRRTGVESAVLSRFMRGERGIALTTFELLAAELGLRVVTKKTPPAGGRG
jgi:transcriptional regulator with XRE-family HTH domain